MIIPPCSFIDSQLFFYFYTHTLPVVNKCFPTLPFTLIFTLWNKLHYFTEQTLSPAYRQAGVRGEEKRWMSTNVFPLRKIRI